ncbi:MAG: hypothetical protein ABIQ52_18380 [Vicinamibacterales bacterium]
MRVIAVLFIVASSAASAQSSPDVQAGGSVAAGPLLAEVQALREDIQRFAGASIRVQMLVARLQLQEQRINALAAQLTEVRQRATANVGQQADLSVSVKRLSEIVSNPPAEIPLEEMTDLRRMLPQKQAELRRVQAEGERLTAQEADLVSQGSAEQGRWLEFNARLDDLEKSLPASARRQ